MSKLYFVTSTMGGGKSTQLLAKDFNYCENGKKTLIVKPTTDTRNGAWTHGQWGKVFSRPMKSGRECLFLDPTRWNEIEKHTTIADKDIIFVDEAQFCAPSDVDEMARWVDEYNVPVLVYGLKTTAEGDLFEGSARLLALADEIEIMISVCSFCGRRASHHVRISGGERLAGNAGVEGNGVTYKACCRRCFKKITKYSIKDEEANKPEKASVLLTAEEVDHISKRRFKRERTTCDICGKEIKTLEERVDAGDRVVCSEKCKQGAVAEFRHWQNAGSI